MPTARKPPRRRDAAATRARLLAVATQEFAERGYDGARVDEVAARARVNKRMIYAYYGDKDGLHREVLSGYAGRLRDLGLRELGSGHDPRAQVEAVVRGYFAFLGEHPRLVRLLAWETLSRDARSRKVLVEAAAVGLGALRAAVRRGIEEGVFRAGLDERRVAASVNALCLGFYQQQPVLEALWSRDLSLPAERDAAVRHLLDLLLDGIRAGGRP